MVTAALKKQVNAPVEVVFDCATDVDNWPQYIRGIVRIEKLTDGPTGIGTRFKETRVMFKKEVTEEMAFSEFERPNRYAIDSESCGCHYHFVFAFTAKDGGTEIEMTMNTKALTFFAKVMSFLMRPLLKSMMKLVAKDLDDLAAACEKSAGPSPAIA